MAETDKSTGSFNPGAIVYPKYSSCFFISSSLFSKGDFSCACKKTEALKSVNKKNNILEKCMLVYQNWSLNKNGNISSRLVSPRSNKDKAPFCKVLISKFLKVWSGSFVLIEIRSATSRCIGMTS